MKNYELLTVFKPNLDVEEVEKAIAKIEENVSGFAGKINHRSEPLIPESCLAGCSSRECVYHKLHPFQR